jgi:hypothetical protein
MQLSSAAKPLCFGRNLGQGKYQLDRPDIEATNSYTPSGNGDCLQLENKGQLAYPTLLRPGRIIVVTPGPQSGTVAVGVQRANNEVVDPILNTPSNHPKVLTLLQLASEAQSKPVQPAG